MIRREFLRNSAVALAGMLMGTGGFHRTAAAFMSGCAPTAAADRLPRVALIVDDIGYSRSRARLFLDLAVPMTFSVLPKLAHSVDLALEIHEKGHEIMLHQPMEPLDSHLNPGPGALFVGSDPGRIAATVEENIHGIPNVLGVNNHMGSRFTASVPDIYRALATIKTCGLFFIDSLTSGRSVAYQTARRMQMPAGCRNMFLDNVPEASAVYRQLVALKQHAAACGTAVGIGHPLTETARGLRRFIEDPSHGDIRLVPISQIL